MVAGAKKQTSYILSRLREARKPTSDLTSSVEDYLEVIYELMKERGYARSVDISEYLGVNFGHEKTLVGRAKIALLEAIIHHQPL